MASPVRWKGHVRVVVGGGGGGGGGGGWWVGVGGLQQAGFAGGRSKPWGWSRKQPLQLQRAGPAWHAQAGVLRAGREVQAFLRRKTTRFFFKETGRVAVGKCTS